MASRFKEDPEERKRRRRQVMDSPHFGVLQGVKGGAKTVRDLLAVLEVEGYVEEVERRWNGGTYVYPAPTEKGRRRLEEGRLFRGENGC